MLKSMNVLMDDFGDGWMDDGWMNMWTDEYVEGLMIGRMDVAVQ